MMKLVEEESIGKESIGKRTVRLFGAGVKVGIVAGLGYLVGDSFCHSSQEEHKYRNTIPPAIIAQIEQQALVEQTPLQQWQKIEREQRDTLYDKLLTTPGEESLIAVLGEMPQHLSYLDKWHLQKRINVGPRTYLFDIRPVLHQNADIPPSVKPDSFSLYLALGGYLITDVSPLKIYHKAIDESALILGIDYHAYVDQIKDIEMSPFYESVRNPTPQDLKKLYLFVSNHIPKFIVDTFYEQAVVSEIADARRMIEADPLVYDTDIIYSKQNDGGTYWNPIADPAHSKFIIQPDRYENGELQFPTQANTGDYIIRGGSLVLPEQWEKQSAFTKWLYRRGPQFIDNFEIMLDAYNTSSNADEFTQQVMRQIKVKSCVESQ